MMDFIPFMALSAVVIVLVAAWGARKAGLDELAAPDDLERLPAAERAFLSCMEEKGFTPPSMRIFRNPDGPGLVIIGEEEIPRRMQSAFAECDNLVATEFGS